MFGHQRLREGKYTPGQIDNKWTSEIIKDFKECLRKNIDKLPVPEEAIQQIINSNKRNW